MSFGWGTKWTSWKNPISFTVHPLEFCLLRYQNGLQNQRSRQNDGGHPKQNPANNYGNRFSSSWSRQNKFDRGKPIKPFPEKLVSWFLAARKSEELRLSVIFFSLRHWLSLLLVKIHRPPQVLREKTRAGAVSEVSGSCKSVMDLFQPFLHHGSVSLSTDTSNSIPIKILTGTGASQSLLLSDTLVFSETSSTCALALLPVPRNKLNCRLFGPYVTEKKLNDLKSWCQHASDKQRRATQVCFSPTLIFCSPICPYTCGVFFFCLCENIYLLWEMSFFVRPLKYANFYPEYYPSCETLWNEFVGPPVFLSEESFVVSFEINPRSLLKLAKNYFFFGE